MNYLDEDTLASINAAEMQHAAPFPWLSLDHLLTAEGFRTLIAERPALTLFNRVFGKSRKYGQQSHDRFALDYDQELPIAQCWHDFVSELNAPPYQTLIQRLFGVDRFVMRPHWHAAPSGCSVSPHCDARRKIGSHIFYLNTEEEWHPDWGGQTLLLDDGGRLDYRSAPAFDDFDRQIALDARGNRSLIFARTDHSWHGVPPLRCPENALRTVFIVAFDHPTGWLGKVRRSISRGAGS